MSTPARRIYTSPALEIGQDQADVSPWNGSVMVTVTAKMLKMKTTVVRP